MRYSPWVVSEHVPDTSTLENIVGSPRFAGLQDEALAIALWQYMVDRDLGIFHYCPPQEPFWKKDCHDPLLIFNVYGFTICHVHAHVLAMLARAAGLPARVANIHGHEGTEMFYSGGWHYFDADVQYFHRKREAPFSIASPEELYRDPSLVDEQPRPSNPYGLPDRPPEKFRKLYESPPEYPELLEEKIHSMDFVLRPGEEIVRYFHHRGRWHVFDNYPEMFKQYPGETGPEGPTERFWPRRQWGNGYFRYCPRLHPDYRDVELGADACVNLDLTEDGLVSSGAHGHVWFSTTSPYLLCGIPDPLRRVRSADGMILSAQFLIAPNCGVEIVVNSYPVWKSEGMVGEVPISIDCTAATDGCLRANIDIKFFGAGTVLRRFETKMWFMVSPHSLPALKAAAGNSLKVHPAHSHAVGTRKFVDEWRFDIPDALDRDVQAKTNVKHDPESFSLLLAEDPSRPWSIAYPLQAAGGRMSWLAAYALYESRKPDDPEDPTPAKIEIADSADGPWRTIAERPLAVHPHGWHFGLFGEGKFSGDRGFIRFSSKKGMKGFRIAAHYLPKEAPPPEVPLEIEHAWYEDDPRVGRRLKTHTERTTHLTHDYVVRCENTPHNESITLRVPSLKR